MTRILKRPTDVLSPLRLPVHALAGGAVRGAAAMLEPRVGAQVPDVRDAAPTAESAVRAELDAMRDSAVREGREQGYAAAQKEVKAALDAELQRSRRVLDGMEAALHDKLASIEPLAVRIAFEAVSVLMGQAYARGEGVTQAVRTLLDASAGATRLRIQVPPAQLEHVRAALASPFEEEARSLSVEADPSLVQACRVVSEHGQLETGLAVQLQAVQDALLRAAAATDGARASEGTP